MLLVLLESLGEDEDIVEVDDHEAVEEGTEKVVHEALEGTGCIAEAERHDEALVIAVPCLEGSLVNVFLENLDLVVSALEVDLGKVLGATKSVEEIVDPW